ncbi:hypothetical protein MHYP_G00094930 [Metynnis hypsauchen]
MGEHVTKDFPVASESIMDCKTQESTGDHVTGDATAQCRMTAPLRLGLHSLLERMDLLLLDLAPETQ